MVTKNLSPKVARESKNLTRVQLAALAGVGINTVIRCELSGRWPLAHEVRARYFKALGLTERVVAL